MQLALDLKEIHNGQDDAAYFQSTGEIISTILSEEIIGTINKAIKDMEKEGMKFKDMNWTLGRYDFVHIFEAPSEKVVMKAMIKVSDFVSTETLIAVPREEALKAI